MKPSRRSVSTRRRADADTLEALSSCFYEAVVEPALWGAALGNVVDTLKADGAAIFSNPSEPGLGIHCLERTAELIDWIARQGPELINPRPERALRRGSPGKIVTESELFSEWELKKLPFNIGMAEEVGLRWEAGGHVGQVAGQPVFLTVQRDANRERFASSDIEFLEALLPDLRQASILAVALGMSKAHGMLQGFEHTGLGAILLDFRGYVVACNTIADGLLGDGLRVDAGQVAATHRGADQVLQQAIGAALGAFRIRKPEDVRYISLPRQRGGPLIVESMPLAGAAGDLFQKGKALLLLRDPDAGYAPSEVALRDLFKLTPGEMKVAMGVAEGKDPAAIAASLGIAVGTVRAHLKSVMAKTGTHRQSELALLLTRLGSPKGGA